MLNKKHIVIIGICVALIIAFLLIIITTSDNNKTIISPEKPSKNNKVPVKIDEDEKEVSNKKAKELYEFIPKIYSEEIAPFTSKFLLTAAMNKIIETDEDLDYSTKNVDNLVTKLFGKEAFINKEEVSEPDVYKSIFYYSKDAKSYAVIPVGLEGIYEHQILKNVTQTDDYYYVYTYTLIGGYSYDETSIIQDEFGDIDYDKTKVEVIVGDKDGNDLVHTFEKFSDIYDDDIWLRDYASVMPIFRYTLKKEKNSYYITEVEQINY